MAFLYIPHDHRGKILIRRLPQHPTNINKRPLHLLLRTIKPHPAPRLVQRRVQDILLTGQVLFQYCEIKIGWFIAAFQDFVGLGFYGPLGQPIHSFSPQGYDPVEIEMTQTLLVLFRVQGGSLGVEIRLHAPLFGQPRLHLAHQHMIISFYYFSNPDLLCRESYFDLPLTDLPIPSFLLNLKWDFRSARDLRLASKVFSLVSRFVESTLLDWSFLLWPK